MDRIENTQRRDPSLKMKVVQWEGKKAIGVHEKARPLVTHPKDVILRVTSTAICGSDLHLYHNFIPGMEKGDVMGHEFMGYVEDVGDEVTNFSGGEKVVACFDIACGECEYCRQGLFSSCDITNPSPMQDSLYGHRTCGMFGYSHVTGGWDGGQAEFVRVPFADVNLLKVPADIPDNKVLFLSDILPTAWHSAEMGEVADGDVVAIWGCGPVGVLSAMCCLLRGAKKVILIDEYNYRLEHAIKKIGSDKILAINFKEKNVVEALREIVGPNGVDVGIDAVGCHYTRSILHSVQTTIGAETDPSEVVNEMIVSVRKGGRLSLVGAYAGFCNHFNLGAFMEKGMTMRGGQTPVQKYWRAATPYNKGLLDFVLDGKLDPTIVITHDLPLEEASEGYRIFDKKLDRCMKVVLHPHGQAAGA